MVQRPVLARSARYRFDTVRGEHQLVFPEGLLQLNETGAQIVQRCDGRPLGELVADLKGQFDGCQEEDVREFIENLKQRGLLRDVDDA